MVKAVQDPPRKVDYSLKKSPTWYHYFACELQGVDKGLEVTKWAERRFVNESSNCLILASLSSANRATMRLLSITIPIIGQNGRTFTHNEVPWRAIQA